MDVIVILLFLLVVGAFVYLDKKSGGTFKRDTSWDFLNDPADLRNKRTSDD